MLKQRQSINTFVTRVRVKYLNILNIKNRSVRMTQPLYWQISLRQLLKKAGKGGAG
ncbi:hypothetical protein V461_07005 [Pantoea ananatis BRT98]|nr:hypothetical protein V461_07005 [Pantoea ananatis BRT98]